MEYKEYLIKDIIQLNYGKSLPKAKRNEGEFPVYGSGGITGYHNEFLVKGPSIIVGRKGTVGSLFYEKRNFFPIDTTYYVLPSSKYDLKYLYYLFQTIGLDKMNTHSAVPGLNRDGVYAKKLLLPSIFYQKKVSHFISLLERKIELNNQMIDTLEEMASTLFKRWFVDFEFPDENGNPYKSSGGKMIDSELGEIPEGWTISSLGKAMEIKSGKRPKNKTNEKSVESDISIVGASKIMGYTSEVLIDESIITTGRVGTHGVIQRFREPIWVSDNSFIIKSKFEGFVYEILKNIDYQSLNRGSTQPLITQTDLKEKIIVHPSKKLLVNFETIYQTNLQMIFELSSQNFDLERLRDLLLPKLLSGEIEF